MKYAIFVPNFGPGPFGNARGLAELARDAENAGWDGFFIWDHIARTALLPNIDPWVALTAIAMRTDSIRFGPMITPLPRRRPWKIARETVSIDHVSNGRLTLGVGIGSGGANEWVNLGEETDPKVRGAMLDEALDVLAGLWSGGSFHYDGQHYPVQSARFVPTPLQSPRIPVWVAGEWPNKAPFRRAARWDGVFPILRRNDDPAQQLKDVLAYIDQHREDDRPLDVVHVGHTPGDDLAAARATVERFASAGATWWFERLTPARYGVDWEDEWPLEQMQARIMQGPPV